MNKNESEKWYDSFNDNGEMVDKKAKAKKNIAMKADSMKNKNAVDRPSMQDAEMGKIDNAKKETIRTRKAMSNPKDTVKSAFKSAFFGG